MAAGFAFRCIASNNSSYMVTKKFNPKQALRQEADGSTRVPSPFTPSLHPLQASFKVLQNPQGIDPTLALTLWVVWSK